MSETLCATCSHFLTLHCRFSGLIYRTVYARLLVEYNIGSFIISTRPACEITVPYEVKTTSGNGGKHRKEKDGDLEFVFEIVDHDADTYPAFEKAGKVVTVNDKQLKDSDFKAEKGSLKLTLKKSYLDSLKAGSYTVSAKFMLNGLEQTGSATFKVLTSSGGGVETGDNTKANNIVSAMILFLMSLSLIAYTLYSNNLISPKLLAAFAGARIERQSDNIEYSVSEDSFDDLEDIVPEDSADDGFDDIID